MHLHHVPSPVQLLQHPGPPCVPPVGRLTLELTIVEHGAEGDSWSFPDFRELRVADSPFREVVGWKDRDGTLYTPNGGEHVRMMSVSAGYFRVLGVTPAMGRDFLPSEDVGPGQHPVAVISDAMWRNRLGGEPDIIGKTLVLNQIPYTVVGVGPAEFTGHRVLTEETEIWTPLIQDPWVAGADSWVGDRASRWLRVLAGVEDGVNME